MAYQAENILISSYNPLIEGVYIVSAQSIEHRTSAQRMSTLGLGNFRPFKRRGVVNQPLTELSVTYVPTGKDIEKILGLTGNYSVLDDISSKLSGKDFTEITISAKDLRGEDHYDFYTLNFQEAALTSYVFAASVEQQAQVSLQFECLDQKVDSTIEPIGPTYNPDIAYPRPFDATFNFPDGIFGIESVIPTGINITIPLARNTQYRIGESKPYRRNISSPVIATVQLTAIVLKQSELTSYDSTQMEKWKAGEPIDEDFEVIIYYPSELNKQDEMIKFTIKKPYLADLSYSSDVQQDRMVQIGLEVPLSFESSKDPSKTLSNIVIS